MNESPSIFSSNQIRLAEEQYQIGNLKRAIGIVKALTFGYPNTSSNHCTISQVLVAYQIHWRSRKDNSTHYDILRISSPFCSYEIIEKKYMNLMVKLGPNNKVSVATKSALRIIKTAWRVLSDFQRRRDYHIENGFGSRIVFLEDEPTNQTMREGKRQCVEIISDDSDSDSDYDFDFDSY